MLVCLVGGSYLINSHVVPRLLETRNVVITIPHNDPHFVKNHCANQLVGALDLHYNGMYEGRRLEEREQRVWLVYTETVCIKKLLFVLLLYPCLTSSTSHAGKSQ